MFGIKRGCECKKKLWGTETEGKEEEERSLAQKNPSERSAFSRARFPTLIR